MDCIVILIFFWTFFFPFADDSRAMPKNHEAMPGTKYTSNVFNILYIVHSYITQDSKTGVCQNKVEQTPHLFT